MARLNEYLIEVLIQHKRTVCVVSQVRIFDTLIDRVDEDEDGLSLTITKNGNDFTMEDKKGNSGFSKMVI